MREYVLGEAGLQEEVFDLHPGHEPVLVVVRLSEQGLIPIRNREVGQKLAFLSIRIQFLDNTGTY